MRKYKIRKDTNNNQDFPFQSKRFLMEIDQPIMGSTFRTILAAKDRMHAQRLAMLMFQTHAVTLLMEVK